MYNFLESRSGKKTVEINGLFLHSSFDPVKEANRFVKSNLKINSTTVVLICPGLNYIADEARKYCSYNIKIVSLYACTIFAEKDNNKSDFIWNAESDLPLKTFLSSVLNELDIEGFSLLKWTASDKIFKRETAYIENILSQYIRELHGNITTLSGFGKRMFSNFIQNYRRTENTFELTGKSDLIVIAASGPGLSESINIIKNIRKSVFLAALPSSISCLLNNDIEPDLIISTDPGYYASLHLSNLDIPVASPLTGAQNGTSQTKNVIFTQNYFLEDEILNHESNFLNIPSNGTVAGSALDLSSTICNSYIIFCGLDLCSSDIQAHCRPHTFDNIIESSSERTNPLHNTYYNRNASDSTKIGHGFDRRNHAMEAYYGWFASNSRRLSNRVLFHNPQKGAPPGYTALNDNQILSLTANSVKNISFTKKLNYPDADTRNSKICEYLLKPRNEIRLLKSDIAKSLDEILTNPDKSIFFNLFLPGLLELKSRYKKVSVDRLSEMGNNLAEEAEIFINKISRYVN